MPGWTSLHALVGKELELAKEDGRNAEALRPLRVRLESAGENADELRAIWDTALGLPRRTDWPFEEPDDLDSIRARRDGRAQSFAVDMGEGLEDQMLGAWLGRCIGCALGKPVECFMDSRNGLRSWQRQKEYLSAISPGEWPLKDYFPQQSPAQERTGRVGCSPSTREEIAWMETDDDIRYTVLGQLVLQQYGRDFSTLDVAETWMEYLPYKFVCTAETQAYRNLVERYEWHQAGSSKQDIDWDWVATHCNPYREWIGAQIRVDSYGYAAVGDPELAAEFAWRDARLSHVKNGIYGAMGCAAMIGAAFGTTDVDAVVEAGLAQIPRSCRLYADARKTMDICQHFGRDFARFEEVLDAIYDELEFLDPVHTNNNYALCVAALLLSAGDPEKAITLAVMGGLDSDCNGATVGSVVGAMVGAKKMPAHFVRPLNDTLNSAIPGYHPIAVSECARRSVDIARRVAR